MNSDEIFKVLSGAIGVINGLINMSENSTKYRQVVAKAVEEGRDLSTAELNALEKEAKDAIAKARQD